MNEVKRRIQSLKRAYRDDGFHGLKILWERQWIRLLSYPQIHQMNLRHRAADAQYQTWFMEMRPGEEERRVQAERAFSQEVSFLIPVYNTRPDLLEALVESFLGQTCPRWQACFYDGASTDVKTLELLRTLEERDPRLHVQFGHRNLGISGNTNEALKMVTTPVIALCDHDDILAEDAVYWILDACERGADFFYSDEDKCNADGTVLFDPHMKTDFSPDALRAGNYICHVMGMSTELIRDLGGLRSECDGSQDHDLALRATEKAVCIAHIPRVLYHWRMLNTSYSHASQERCALAALKSVQDQLERLDMKARADMVELNPVITYEISENTDVSLILHGHEAGLDRRWLKKLLERTGQSCRWFREIILVGCDVPAGMPASIPIKSAATLNEAASAAGGKLLLFLESGTLPVFDLKWLDGLVMYATRPWLGCVGGGIVDQKNNYLMCGYAVNVPGCALPRFRGENRMGATYQLYDRKVQDVTAVSSACLMIRRDLFLSMGGFGEFRSDLRSVSLGMQCMAHGLYNAVIPDSVMRQRHPEKGIVTLPYPDVDCRLFKSLYGEHPMEHFYSPHFEREVGSMTIDFQRHEQPGTMLTRFDG